MTTKTDTKNAETQDPQPATFDTRAFKNQTFTPREGEVDVSEGPLKKFFASGAKVVWKVRGLVANEVAISNEAKQTRELVKMNAIIEALTGFDQSGIIDGLKKIMGDSNDVSGEISKMLKQFVFGSVNPKVEESTAVKIAVIAPRNFYDIVRKIDRLTNKGQIPGESKPSGTEKTSK